MCHLKNVGGNHGNPVPTTSVSKKTRLHSVALDGSLCKRKKGESGTFNPYGVHLSGTPIHYVSQP
jgi:hypothetical protein